MRDSRAGKIGFLSDRTYAQAFALAHAHHLQDQMLPVFITQGEQKLPAAFKFFSQLMDLF